MATTSHWASRGAPPLFLVPLPPLGPASRKVRERQRAGRTIEVVCVPITAIDRRPLEA